MVSKLSGISLNVTLHTIPPSVLHVCSLCADYFKIRIARYPSAKPPSTVCLCFLLLIWKQSLTLINRLHRLHPTIHSPQLPHPRASLGDKSSHVLLTKTVRHVTPLLFLSTNEHSSSCCPCL